MKARRMTVVSPAVQMSIVPKKQPAKVQAIRAVEREGCGSTNVMFDLYLDAASRCADAFSPERFEQILREVVKKSKMTLRMSLLDVWETKQSGPASSHHSLHEQNEQFISLGESHLRTETWPENNHVQGEAQLCNYSRDNSRATRALAENIIKALNPVSVQILIVTRGPGPNLVPQERIVWERDGRIYTRKY